MACVFGVVGLIQQFQSRRQFFLNVGIKSLFLMVLLYAAMILIIWQIVVIKYNPDYIRGVFLSWR